jgi:CheY-like chemotaxis protein
MRNQRPIHILLADDDEDDRMLTEQAFIEGKLNNTLSFVKDGEELMDYLHQRNGFTKENAIRPGIILLDLNMPKKDGRDCLKELKSNPDLKHIPVVVLTTSKNEQDVLKTYNLGVNSFIVKPVTFQELVDIILGLDKYWFQIVELPK